MHGHSLARHEAEVDDVGQWPDDVVGRQCGHKLGLQGGPDQLW